MGLGTKAPAAKQPQVLPGKLPRGRAVTAPGPARPHRREQAPQQRPKRRSLSPARQGRHKFGQQRSAEALSAAARPCKLRPAQQQTAGGAGLHSLPPPSRPGLDLERIAGAHKPVGLIFGSAHILATACQLTGACCLLAAALCCVWRTPSLQAKLPRRSAGACRVWRPATLPRSRVPRAGLESPCWEAAAVGACAGALYAALNRFGMRRTWRRPVGRLNVVITGASKGLGKSLAREFLR